MDIVQPEIICFGEALIDIVPLKKGTSLLATGEMRLAAGGAPANVAVGLARLGNKVGFMGRVGSDLFGPYLRDILEKEGVETSHLSFDNQAKTGLAFVSWDERGDASYTFYRNPSADTLFSPLDIDKEYLAGARVFQFGSLLLASEPSASATFEALKIASHAGLLLSYDLNLRLSNWQDISIAREVITRPLNFANIVKINRPELLFLTGESDPVTGTARLWQDPFKLLVVTLDKEGCFYRTATHHGFISGRKVEAVDTVGAGDGFMAGLLDGLRLADFSFEIETAIKAACHQGVVVGALTVTKPGAIPAMPTRQEVDAFSL